jgi:hypothetical protein
VTIATQFRIKKKTYRINKLHYSPSRQVPSNEGQSESLLTDLRVSRLRPVLVISVRVFMAEEYN